MIEVFLVALLVWLWVIERRLHSLNDTVRTLRLDVDGLRAIRAAGNSNRQAPDAPHGLPEVTSIGRSNPAGTAAAEAPTPGKARVH